MTLQEAKDQGYIKKRQFYYDGDEITINGIVFTKNYKKAISKTAWRRKGLGIKSQEEPVAIIKWGRGSGTIIYGVYTEYQTEPLIKSQIRESLLTKFKNMPEAMPFMDPESEVDLLIFSDWLEEKADKRVKFVKKLAQKWIESIK